MAGVTVYASTDASAPVVDGSIGKRFNDLARACLVTGYGTKPGLGWTIPFEDATKIILRPPQGTQFFYPLVDLPLGSSQPSGVYDAVGPRGYEVALDLVTGTNPFPTLAQVTGNNGMVAYHKQGVGPVNWFVVADERTAYFWINAAAAIGWAVVAIGDYYTHKVPDLFNAMVVHGFPDSFGAFGSLDRLSNFYAATESTPNALDGHYIARSYNQVAGAVKNGVYGDNAKSANGNAGILVTKGPIVYPNPPDGSIHLAPLYINEPSVPATHGRYRGLWHWLHSTAGIGTGDTFTGTGEFAGKTFLLITEGPTGGVYCVEISNTWLTNAGSP